MLRIKSIETEEVKLMLGVSLIIIAAAIVYMVETYISTYYTIEYMHGTALFLILLAKYGTPVLFLLLCAYIAYRNFLKKQKAAASAASERPTSKEELYTNKIQTALTPPTIEIVGFPGLRLVNLTAGYCSKVQILQQTSQSPKSAIVRKFMGDCFLV